MMKKKSAQGWLSLMGMAGAKAAALVPKPSVSGSPARICCRIVAGLLAAVLLGNACMPLPRLYAQDMASQLPLLEGLTFSPTDPLRFDFIFSGVPVELAARPAEERQIRYFFAALALQGRDLWVNLSPNEKDRIIPDLLAVTDMGRSMLEVDYRLKQRIAALLHPDSSTGQKYWEAVRTGEPGPEKTGLLSDALAKVWIVPGPARVAASGQGVFVTGALLSVRAGWDHRVGPGAYPVSGEQLEILRETILPQLERDVNESPDFLAVRQIYRALVLATWFKRQWRDSVVGRGYADLGKVGGIDTSDPRERDRVWERYVASFRAGAFNLVREDRDALTGDIVPRKYFSGGMSLDMAEVGLEPARDAAALERGGSHHAVTVEAGFVHRVSRAGRSEVPTGPSMLRLLQQMRGAMSAPSKGSEKPVATRDTVFLPYLVQGAEGVTPGDLQSLRGRRLRVTYSVIADETGVPLSTVALWAGELGLVPAGRPLDKTHQSLVRHLESIDSGYSLLTQKEIADHFGVNQSVVAYYLSRLGKVTAKGGVKALSSEEQRLLAYLRAHVQDRLPSQKWMRERFGLSRFLVTKVSRRFLAERKMMVAGRTEFGVPAQTDPQDADKAEAVNGGVDLDPGLMALETEGQARPVQPDAVIMHELARAAGLRPVIIGTRLVENLPACLGLETSP